MTMMLMMMIVIMIALIVTLFNMIVVTMLDTVSFQNFKCVFAA